VIKLVGCNTTALTENAAELLTSETDDCHLCVGIKARRLDIECEEFEWLVSQCGSPVNSVHGVNALRFSLKADDVAPTGLDGVSVWMADCRGFVARSVCDRGCCSIPTTPARCLSNSVERLPRPVLWIPLSFSRMTYIGNLFILSRAYGCIPID
jgi:hypothetical protein